MNAITNAFKRAHGIAEEKITNEVRQSTGHRKLLAENIVAKKSPLGGFVDANIAARAKAKKQLKGK